jgi:hypothetical protein
MVLFGQSERGDPTGVECVGGALAGDVVAALPDRAETQHRHLHRIPIIEPVETEDFRELRDTTGVPALAGVAVSVRGGREEGGEEAFLRGEFEEVRVEDLGVVVLDELVLTAGLEPVDGRAQQSPGLRVEPLRVVALRVQQQRLAHVFCPCFLAPNDYPPVT